MNGEIKNRENLRSLKKVDNPNLKGMYIGFNYICEHMGLEEKRTPAEKAGIEIEGDNKWLAFMQNTINLNLVPN